MLIKDNTFTLSVFLFVCLFVVVVVCLFFRFFSTELLTRQYIWVSQLEESCNNSRCDRVKEQTIKHFRRINREIVDD